METTIAKIVSAKDQKFIKKLEPCDGKKGGKKALGKIIITAES